VLDLNSGECWGAFEFRCVLRWPLGDGRLEIDVEFLVQNKNSTEPGGVDLVLDPFSWETLTCGGLVMVRIQGSTRC
jgi:hypothetical protein